MRDPKRIPKVLWDVAEAWHARPDLRLGQLLIVASGSCDPFRIEDEELSTGLRAVSGRMDIPSRDELIRHFGQNVRDYIEAYELLAQSQTSASALAHQAARFIENIATAVCCLYLAAFGISIEFDRNEDPHDVMCRRLAELERNWPGAIPEGSAALLRAVEERQASGGAATYVQLMALHGWLTDIAVCLIERSERGHFGMAARLTGKDIMAAAWKLQGWIERAKPSLRGAGGKTDVGN